MGRLCSKGKSAPPTLKMFLSKPLAENKGLQSVSPEKILDMQAFVEHLPDVELRAEVVVEDESDIAVGDIATVKVEMKRNNLKEGEVAGRVHAPLFPEAKFEEWWFLLAEPGGRLIGAECIRDMDSVCECKILLQVSGKPGRRKLDLHAHCDSYAGLDKKIDLLFRVVKATDAHREIIVHKEDEDLDLMPTLFQQLMGDLQQFEEESDDEGAAGPGDGEPGKKNKKPSKVEVEDSPDKEPAEDGASSSASSDSD